MRLGQICHESICNDDWLPGSRAVVFYVLSSCFVMGDVLPFNLNSDSIRGFVFALHVHAGLAKQHF